MQSWWTRSKFGSEIAAYALNQNIGLRLPQESVVASLNKLFGFHLPVQWSRNRLRCQAMTVYTEKIRNALRPRTLSRAGLMPRVVEVIISNV